MAFNEKFKKLQDYKVIEGTVTDYYHTRLKEEGARRGWNEYYVLILDDSIRIGFVKGRYKEYIDSLQKHIQKREQVKVYVEEEDLATYRDEDYTYSSNERPRYADYYMFPEQLELKKAVFIRKKDVDTSKQPLLTNEEIAIMIACGDSSFLEQATIVEMIEVVVPESYDTWHNRIGGAMILVIFAAIFIFFVLGFMYFLRMTPEQFEKNSQKWKEEKEKEIFQGTPGSPNHIPLWERVYYSILSMALLTYGTFGLLVDDLYIPGKRGTGTHLHGVTAWMMYSAFLCAIANMFSVVVDHYDKRNNEIEYKKFARISHLWGVALFFTTLAFDLYFHH